MLYATDGIKSDEDFNKGMVGVASVWQVLFSSFPGFTIQLGFSGMKETRTYFVFLLFLLQSTCSKM